jgi:chromosome condensin MukBEF ATPase and DNA-binding subunit MukB
MGYVQQVENARLSQQIDEQVAKFRKETLEMRDREDELRAQRLIKHRRAAVWINKQEALAHLNTK